MAAHGKHQPEQKRTCKTKAAISRALDYGSPPNVRQESNNECTRNQTLELSEILPIGRVKIDRQVRDKARHGSDKRYFDEDKLTRFRAPQQLFQGPYLMMLRPNCEKKPYPGKIENEEVRHPFRRNSVEIQGSKPRQIRASLAHKHASKCQRRNHSHKQKWPGSHPLHADKQPREQSQQQINLRDLHPSNQNQGARQYDDQGNLLLERPYEISFAQNFVEPHSSAHEQQRQCYPEQKGITIDDNFVEIQMERVFRKR